MTEDTFVTQAPLAIQPLLREREELLQVFPHVYTKEWGDRIQFKTNNLNGVLLCSNSGCLIRAWGEISELQVLQAQRLWAIGQVLLPYLC